MTDAATIAKGLTEAQRIVLEQAATHDMVVMPLSVSRKVYQGGLIPCLKPMNCRDERRCQFAIKRFGLEVRRLLQAHEGASDE